MHGISEAMKPSRSVSFLFPTAGRDSRIKDIQKGFAPEDFFYGGLYLENKLGKLGYVNLRANPEGALSNLFLLWERVRNRLMNFGPSRQRVRAFSSQFSSEEMILSFTDSGSLSIGLNRDLLPDSAVLVGGFHGLCDISDEVPKLVRSYVENQIRLALKGLDHCFFFGELDREEAIDRFNLEPAKTSLFPFGVDIDFWKPCEEETREFDRLVFAVGSDPKRDYSTLVKAVGQNYATRILTRLPVVLEGAQANIELVSGSLHGSKVTDVVLRELYWKASMVVVPVRDVVQPSGYSVSLQAMACGRPVIISDIKGLWDRHLFRNGENCLLVPPGDSDALAAAIDRLHVDAELRKAMGEAARETALENFSLTRMNQGLSQMVEMLQQRYQLQ